MRLKRKYKYRSSITGRYVPWWYAKLHPDTTVREYQSDYELK